MALLLIIIFTVLTILLICCNGELSLLFMIMLLAISILLASIAGYNIINGRVIDAKIEMYQEENTKIENEMTLLVDKYMDYESETLSKFKNESSVTLVSLYPELKADELVQQQVSIYKNNNNQIKQLKLAKINISNWRWWLYFGK